ncbi:MAG: CBS domain-containing protein [Bradymonadia bacterium]
MQIGEIMSTDVVTVEADTPLVEVQRVLEEHGFHHLLVTSYGRLVGVISDRDVIKAVSPFLDTLAEKPRDLDTLKRPAHQIMTRAAISVDERCSVQRAAEVLLSEDISSLVVLGKDGKVAGIATWRDLMRVLASAEG